MRSQKLSETIAASILVSRPTPVVPPSPCYPRPSITLDECISRRRRERFEILPRLGVRADEKNCNRIGVFFQLAIVERSSASNDRPSGHGGFFFSFPLFPFSLSFSLQISWPTAKNQSARFFPPISPCLFHDDCRFHFLFFVRFGKIRRPSIRIPHGEMS